MFVLYNYFNFFSLIFKIYKTKNIINECLFKILLVEISRNFPSIMPALYIKRVLKYTRIIAVIPFGSTFGKVEKILSDVKKNNKKKKIEMCKSGNGGK